MSQGQNGNPVETPPSSPLSIGSEEQPHPPNNPNTSNKRANQSAFFVGGTPFSVYEEMGRQLIEAGWRAERRGERMTQCSLILGDRFDIPYHILRSIRRSDADDGKCWVNYFRGSHKLTLKAPMAKELAAYEPSSSQWMPKTFVLCSDTSSKRGVKDEREMLAGCLNDLGPVWIVKPSSGCKGRGMLVSDDYRAICSFADTNAKTVFVVQRYIDRPLLVRGGRKFDIRVWALLVHPYTIYMYSEASCRTASVAYSRAALDDQMVHITNHCLQEHSDEFGQYEEANEIMFSELDAHAQLQSKEDCGRGEPAVGADVCCDADEGGGARGVSVRRILQPQMADIIVKTLLCVKEELEVDASEPYACFQLFGYDFMADEDLKVHLLEINGSPGAAERLLPSLVEGMLSVIFASGGIESAPPPVTRCDSAGTILPQWMQLHPPPCSVDNS